MMPETPAVASIAMTSEVEVRTVIVVVIILQQSARSSGGNLEHLAAGGHLDVLAVHVNAVRACCCHGHDAVACTVTQK